MEMPGLEPGAFHMDLLNYYKNKVMEKPGFEPGTFHMRSKRSTTELHPHITTIILVNIMIHIIPLKD